MCQLNNQIVVKLFLLWYNLVVIINGNFRGGKYDSSFPKDYYDVIVEDTRFESNAIYLRSHSSEFDDVEIARYIN